MRPGLYVLVPVVCGFGAVLGGCATHSVATVQDRGISVRHPESATREVRAGDTLYSIAWESGRDYRDLARWNALEPPYIIRPGQKIRLYPPGSAPRARGGFRTVAKGDTLYAIAKRAGLRYSDVAAWNGLKPPYVIVPGQRLRLTPPPDAGPRAHARGGAPRDHSTVRGRIAWRWPAAGTVIAHFAPGDGAKGIDIAGRAGEAVYAAAPGKVVYRGSGLRGYGRLIIVKHNDDFLSAYAHCAAIYVQEGSVVKAGQKIAAMGRSGSNRVKLHFEIRRRGVPVDPLDHLPKK